MAIYASFSAALISHIHALFNAIQRGHRLKEQELSMKKAAGKERRDQIYKDYMRKKDAVSPPITGRHPGAATCRSPASGYHDHTGQDHTDTSTAAAAASRSKFTLQRYLYA